MEVGCTSHRNLHLNEKTEGNSIFLQFSPFSSLLHVSVFYFIVWTTHFNFISCVVAFLHDKVSVKVGEKFWRYYNMIKDWASLCCHYRSLQQYCHQHEWGQWTALRMRLAELPHGGWTSAHCSFCLNNFIKAVIWLQNLWEFGMLGYQITGFSVFCHLLEMNIWSEHWKKSACYRGDVKGRRNVF